MYDKNKMRRGIRGGVGREGGGRGEGGRGGVREVGRGGVGLEER